MTLEDLGFEKRSGTLGTGKVWYCPLSGTGETFVLRKNSISYEAPGGGALLDWAMVEALRDYNIKHKKEEVKK